MPKITQPMRVVVLQLEPDLTPEFTPSATPHPSSSPDVVLNSSFLPHQNPQYEFKEAAGNFTPGLAQPAAYYPYEQSLGQYQYDR